jgi:glutamine amidotransferase
MITIIDYNIGNIGSLFNMVKKICSHVCIASDPNLIRSARKIILPGVGAFDAAMSIINSNSGLKDILGELILTRSVPVLGICLGMQIMMQDSEEGSLPGLGWVPGRVRRFPPMRI